MFTRIFKICPSLTFWHISGKHMSDFGYSSRKVELIVRMSPKSKLIGWVKLKIMFHIGETSNSCRFFHLSVCHTILLRCLLLNSDFSNVWDITKPKIICCLSYFPDFPNVCHTTQYSLRTINQPKFPHICHTTENMPISVRVPEPDYPLGL